MAQLTLDRRYVIQEGINRNLSNQQIGIPIDKDRSVIHRELKRNSDERNGEYKANLAHTKATNRHIEKAKKISFTPAIEAYVCKYINEDYSPEQIVGKANIDGQNYVSI